MKKLSSVLALLVVVACSDVTGPVQTLTGDWVGVYTGANSIRMTLQQTGNSVSGMAVLHPDDWAIQPFDTFSVTGTYSHSTATLLIAGLGGGGDYHFSGSVAGSNLSAGNRSGDSLYLQLQCHSIACLREAR